MSELNTIFEMLPSMKIINGISYSPILKKGCDGYYSACYVADDGKFILSDGTGYPTPLEALKALQERL